MHPLESSQTQVSCVQITGASIGEAEDEVAAAVDRIFTFAALADKAGGTVQESTLKVPSFQADTYSFWLF